MPKISHRKDYDEPHRPPISTSGSHPFVGISEISSSSPASRVGKSEDDDATDDSADRSVANDLKSPGRDTTDDRDDSKANQYSRSRKEEDQNRIGPCHFSYTGSGDRNESTAENDRKTVPTQGQLVAPHRSELRRRHHLLRAEVGALEREVRNQKKQQETGNWAIQNELLGIKDIRRTLRRFEDSERKSDNPRDSSEIPGVGRPQDPFKRSSASTPPRVYRG